MQMIIHSDGRNKKELQKQIKIWKKPFIEGKPSILLYVVVSTQRKEVTVYRLDILRHSFPAINVLLPRHNRHYAIELYNT